MKKQGLPTYFQFGGNHITFEDLNNRFASTSYGERLKNSIRYGPFKPSEITNSGWVKLLGPDANNFDHLNITLDLAKNFLSKCANPPESWIGRVPDEASFTSSEQEMLLLTAAIHDWGEAIIGDIPFPAKKNSDLNKEMIALRMLMHEVIGESNHMKDCDRLADSVIGVLTVSDGAKLGKAFKTIEEIGYMTTGLRAWVEAANHNGNVHDCLEQLGFQVTTNHLSSVFNCTLLYPPVDEFLNKHKDLISILIVEGVERYSGNQEELFLEAKRAWQSQSLR